MKEGFTLFELMVVINIIALLATVVVPTTFRMICKSKLDHCKVETPSTYKDVCLREPKLCPITDVDNLVQSYRAAKMDAEDKTQPEPQPVVETMLEVVHDTVYVVVKDSSVSQVTEVRSSGSVNESCIARCIGDNVSPSLIDFCIKEECR